MYNIQMAFQFPNNAFGTFEIHGTLFMLTGFGIRIIVWKKETNSLEKKRIKCCERPHA